MALRKWRSSFAPRLAELIVVWEKAESGGSMQTCSYRDAPCAKQPIFLQFICVTMRRIAGKGTLSLAKRLFSRGFPACGDE